MSALQVDLYKDVLRSKSVAALMSGRASEPSEGVLSIITSLRKLCNHPDLLYSSSSGDKQASLLPRASALLCKPPIPAPLLKWHTVSVCVLHVDVTAYGVCLHSVLVCTTTTVACC